MNEGVIGVPYIPPPLSTFEKDRGKPGHGDIKATANLIKRTLQNFGIQVEMDEVSIGPSVTRYALKPAEGVRLSKIVGLQNNFELTLAAHPVRFRPHLQGAKKKDRQGIQGSGFRDFRQKQLHVRVVHRKRPALSHLDRTRARRFRQSGVVHGCR